MTVVFHSHGAFGRPSKWSTFVLDSFKWTPPGVPTWIYVRGKSPGIVNLRENKRYAHEVAAKLIEEKRQELENGTSQKDLLSLLGSSCVPFTRVDIRYEILLSSQGKFLSAKRFAGERRGNYWTISVGLHPPQRLSIQIPLRLGRFWLQATPL